MVAPHIRVCNSKQVQNIFVHNSVSWVLCFYFVSDFVCLLILIPFPCTCRVWGLAGACCYFTPFLSYMIRYFLYSTYFRIIKFVQFLSFESSSLFSPLKQEWNERHILSITLSTFSNVWPLFQCAEVFKRCCWILYRILFIDIIFL